MATDMRFIESIGQKKKSAPQSKPTLPRWSELIARKRKKVSAKVTKEDVKARMLELREENRRRKDAKRCPTEDDEEGQ